MKHNPKPGYVDKGKFAARREDTERDGKGEKDDKLSALMAHRKKLGLCFKCGEKWAHNHKCPQHIPLHVLEEILDAIEPVEDGSDDESDTPLDSESPVLAISDKTEPKQPTRRTMKLLGTIGKQHVLILVDSGSIGTFVSNTLVDKLQLPTVPCTELTNQPVEVRWSAIGWFSSSLGLYRAIPFSLKLKCCNCNAMT